MTTVKDGITWLAYETEIKEYLGVTDASEDARLELWLDGACGAADQYIDADLAAVSDQNPLGVDPDFDARPWSAIKAGVFEWMRIIRSGTLRPFGLTSRKTEDLSESYQTTGEGTAGAIAAQHATAAACDYWQPFKDQVLL